MIIYFEVAGTSKLLEKHYKIFIDDINYRLRDVLELHNLQIPELQLKNHILFDLEKLFNKNYSSLSNYNLLKPNRIIAKEINNSLLRDELDYDVH